MLVIVACIILAIVVIGALDLLFGVRSMQDLAAVAPAEGQRLPKVSVIVPVCNEEAHVEAAVRSHLHQQYPHLEVVVVNDRSSDGTTAILARLKKEYANLRVVQVDDLPSGWVGKAHALQCGADAAGGAFLLFTDGDVQMAATTVARAVRHMTSRRLDHIALIFKNVSPGLLLNSLILDSGLGLLQLFRPWRARRAESRFFVGVGAFNMARREVYQAVGGHRSIRLHPVDDLMLGKVIKRGGYRQECLLGLELVRVPWYGGVKEMIDGLMKNALAFINYRFVLLPAPLLAVVLLNIVPFWGMLLGHGASRIIFLGAVLVKMAVSFFGTRRLGISPWCVPATLLTPYLTVYIMLRAAWRNYRHRGIYWRGTFYALHDLRHNESVLPWQ